jgi:bifunctional UDP-N-acetylglucosamine pyrophosphorylase/glucosamine-1-phosphate N-acetyltransferase
MPLATVILAAGLGTRMKSRTAKVLHEVAGRPMIEYPVALARALAAERVVAVLGHQADAAAAALEARFGPGAVQVALQAEQRGTGHAALCARPALEGFSGRVLILYGDVPLLGEPTLRALVSAGEGRALAMVTFRPADPRGYGRIVRGAGGRIERVVEERDADPAERAIGEANAGIYCAEARFLFDALDRLSPDNAQGELYLTDVVAEAARTGEVASVEAPFEEVMGVNDRVELARADGILRRRICAALQREGVTIRAPEATFIDTGVEVAADAEIGPLVELRGATRIGAGARIDAGSVLEDAIVEEGAHVKPYCVIEQSRVGRAAQIGPFAHLRPGTELGAKVKIGNFVETKKARLDEGAKASHLTYLGDCEVGADANIGCGTITCNYDGVTKNRTVIGARAFIGSDSQLVAPVTIGSDATVAAGTTVVEDVPPGALALSRAPQLNKPGYAEKKRARREAKPKTSKG